MTTLSSPPPAVSHSVRPSAYPARRKQGWLVDEPVALNHTSLRQLLNDEIPLVVLRDFATPEECANLVAAAKRIGFDPYQQVSPPIDRIGMTVFEYNAQDMNAYFRAAEEKAREQQAIFSASFDPLQRFLKRLELAWGDNVGVAQDPERGRYHAGLVRRIENGTLLHIDYAAAEQPDWHVRNVTQQLAWNLYLELPQSGGKTHVYNRQWRAEDEKHKVAGTYGYDSKVVAGAPRVTFQPTLGDIYIFNTRNFHEVDTSNGNRTTFTSAMGTMGSRLALWS